MNVCKECPYKGCGRFHDVCKAYQKEKADNEKRREKRRLEQEIDTALYQINRAGKNNRRLSA